MSFIYEITCSDCGRELGLEKSGIDDGHDLFIQVKPCPKCISAAKEEGRKEDRDLADAEEADELFKD